MQNVFGGENKVKKKKKREWVSKCKLKVISVFRFLTPALFFLVVGTYYTILGRRLFSTCDLSPSNSLQIIVSALPADTLPEARATKPAGTVPSLLSRYFFLHRKKKEKKMKLGKVEFCHFLQLIALFLCFSGMSQAEFSRSGSKPYFQSGRSRTKRSWVWNQFFVLEEYMGSDPLYVGKVGYLAFPSHNSCECLWLNGERLIFLWRWETQSCHEVSGIG